MALPCWAQSLQSEPSGEASDLFLQRKEATFTHHIRPHGPTRPQKEVLRVQSQGPAAWGWGPGNSCPLLSISQGELEWTGGHQTLPASLSALHQESRTPFSSWPSFWEDGSLGAFWQWYLSTSPNVGFLLIFIFLWTLLSINTVLYKSFLCV